MQNLLNAKNRLNEIEPGLGDKVIMVWDRQSEKSGEIADHHSKLPGGYRGTDKDAIREFGLVAVDDVRDVTAAVLGASGSDQKEKIGWIVDHDDVISEDNIRNKLQEESVISLIEKLFAERASSKEAA